MENTCINHQPYLHVISAICNVETLITKCRVCKKALSEPWMEP